MNNFLSTENGAVLLHPKGFPINLNSQISNILKENDRGWSINSLPAEIIVDLSRLEKKPEVFDVFGISMSYNKSFAIEAELLFSKNKDEYYFWGAFLITQPEFLFFEIDEVDSEYNYLKIIINSEIDDSYVCERIFLSSKSERNPSMIEAPNTTKEKLKSDLMDMESQINNMKNRSFSGKTMEIVKEQFTTKKENLEFINEQVEKIFLQNDEIVDRIKELTSTKKISEEATVLLENKVKNFIEEVFQKQNEIRISNENLKIYLNFLSGYDDKLAFIRESKRLKFEEKNFDGKLSNLLEKEYIDLEKKIQHNFQRLESKLSSELGIARNQEYNGSEGKNENILNLLRVLQTKMILKKEKLQQLKEISFLESINSSAKKRPSPFKNN